MKPDTIFDLSHAERQARYAVNVLGALTTMAYFAPRMAEAGAGTILVTAGMPKPHPQVVSLSIDKAALRVAAALVADQYGDQGVHVATVTIGGAVAPGTCYDPSQIAEEYWRVHCQVESQWEPDIVYWGDPRAPDAGHEGAGTSPPNAP